MNRVFEINDCDGDVLHLEAFSQGAEIMFTISGENCAVLGNGFNGDKVAAVLMPRNRARAIAHEILAMLGER